MRKIIKIFLSTVIFFIAANYCEASNSVTVGDIISDYKIKLIYNGELHYEDIRLITDNDTGELLYTLGPLQGNETGEYELYKEPNSEDEFLKQNWEMLKVISYYGYGYKDRTDIKWYIITQFLILEQLYIGDGALTFADSNNYDVIAYQEELEQIKHDILHFGTYPLFSTDYGINNSNLTAIPSKETYFVDQNKVLDKFDITANSTVKYRVDKNTLYFNSTSYENEDISFNYKDLEKAGQIYYRDDQSVLVNRNSMFDAYTITVNMIVKNLTIHINTEQTNLTLEGIKFNVYNKYDDSLIGTILTDENGLGIIRNISEGDFYIEQVLVPEGFIKNPEKVYFSIGKEDVALEFKNDIIKKDVEIENCLDSNCSKDFVTSSAFEIYNKKNGNLLKTVKPNKNGKINLSLEYGNYIIKQTKVAKGYLKISDYEFVIDKNTSDLKIILENSKITQNLTIIYKDLHSDKLITSPLKFKIKNVDTNEYIKINGKEIFSTSKGQINLEKIPYGNYEIEEITAPYSYQLNSNKTFKINNSDVTIYIYGKKELIEVTITKYLIYYNEKKALEEGAIFEIYSEDENQLINTSKTDKNGKIFLNISYGKYYIKQISGAEGFNLAKDYEFIFNDKTNKEVELNSKQMTGTIKISLLDQDTEQLIKSASSFKIKNINTNTYFILNDKEIFEIKDGTIYIENIPYGNYEIEETEVPLYYKKGDENLKFSISSETKDVELIIYNLKEKGSLVLYVYDPVLKEALEGIKYYLYNNSNELIRELISDSNGLITVNDLEVGDYYIKDGIADENINITIKPNIKNVITINNRVKTEVPITSAKEFLIALIISVIMLVIGIFLCNHGKKND